MTCRVKALGLALAAIGVGAQGASATVVEHEFQSESTPTILKGTDEPGTNHTFTVGGFAEVDCEASHVGRYSGGIRTGHVGLAPDL